MIPIGQFNGQVPQFRFTFGSDPSVQYPGFFFDDMIIVGLSEPNYAPVSGTVSIDGGAGAVTAVTVHADGLGNPIANPAGNGAYTLANVLVGARTIWATLAGYHDATTNVTVPEGGLTNVNLTLVRLDPPVPTGLAGEVNNGTGLVTLTWTTSPDPLVDSYNIYRRLQGDTDFVLVGNDPASPYTETFAASGIYQYAISALDEDVSTPVESDLTDPVTVLYGELPPSGLSANGDFDNKIVLDWFEPGTPPEFELFYDDGGPSDVDGIGWWGGLPSFGWMVAKFQTDAGPATITRIKFLITSFGTAGDPIQVGVFDAAGGLPTFTPLGVVDLTQDDALFDQFREVELTTPVTITGGVFYIGLRQMTTGTLAVGGDSETPFVNNTFYYSFDAASWVSYEPALLTIPMIRCFAIGQFGAMVELEPAPIDVSSLKPSVTEAPKSDNSGTLSKSGKAGKSVTSVVPVDRLTSSLENEIDFKALVTRGASAVAAHAPNITVPLNRHHGNSLDEVLYYIVYRRPSGAGTFADIGHPTTEHFENTGLAENVLYDYQVTAWYDNSEESGATLTVTAECNMAPAAPTNVTAVSTPPSGVFITWVPPITNADGSACVDLAGTRVYRDGTLITTVAAGTNQYTDDPPAAGYYEWTLAAVDEVPNVSDLSLGASAISGNPSYYSNFDADDGGFVSDDQAGWQWGSPTIGPGAAHSGANCWSNGLTVNYPNDACHHLTLAPEIVITQPTASAEFWMWYQIETGWDGLTFQVSTDGSTWEDVVPETGYPGITNTANACNPSTPCWTSSTAIPWFYVALPLAAYVGETPQFRFEFGSDASVTYPGAFIDDFVIWGGGPSGEIAGLVREMGSGTAIPGAEVTAEGVPEAIAITNAQGMYSLQIEPGTYTVTAHKQGYCDLSQANVVVEDGNTTTRNFSMLQPAGAVDLTSMNLQTSVNVDVDGELLITNPGAGCRFEYSITSDVTWLSFDPEDGEVAPNGSQTVTVTATVAGLGSGQHNATISIEHNDNNSPLEIPVLLEIFLAANDPHSIPTEFAFFQNYPNPFNATTALNFDIPVESNVEIAIFNVMGQEVARPVSGNFQPGHHKILYTADGLPSGMYLVKMTAGSFSGLQKMVLLK